MSVLSSRLRRGADAEWAERERRHRERWMALAEGVQRAATEADASLVLKRHLERDVRGRQVTILTADAAADRLEQATPHDDAAPLARAIEQASPRSCVAIRLGRAHEGRAHDDPLLACDVCGAAGRERRCTRLVVGGELLGSVLTIQDQPFDDDARHAIDAAVTIVAPALANLRALARAEARAATDAATGLANRAAVDDTLSRMVAQARRSGATLTAIALAIDGRDHDDRLLPAVAATIAGAIRTSDFAGRLDADELLVLAPGTPLEGGVVLAEKLRQAIAELTVAGVERAITASLGVAAYPDAAVTPEILLRSADRALELAKGRGGNRVERVAGTGWAPVAATPA